MYNVERRLDHYHQQTPRPLANGDTLTAENLQATIRAEFVKMYEQEVVVICAFCEACNAISSSVCVKCGGPLGNARKLRE